VVMNPRTDPFADPAKGRAIDFEGTYYRCSGPGVPDRGKRLWRHTNVGMMGANQQRVLLKKVVMAAQHHATSMPGWAVRVSLRTYAPVGQCLSREKEHDDAAFNLPGILVDHAPATPRL
jgi:hypothetical protein